MEEEDLLDSLRMEVSPLPPSTERELREIVGVIQNSIINLWGEYIPEEKRDVDVSHKTIVASSEFYEELGVLLDSSILRQILPSLSDRISGRKFGESGGVFNRDFGGVSLLPDDVFERDNSAIELCRRLSHETVHHFHNPQLFSSFLEIGAWYYASMIMESAFNIPPQTELELAVRGFYENLLEKYGDAVHRIYFGNTYLFSKEVPVDIRTSIRREFNSPEAKELSRKVA